MTMGEAEAQERLMATAARGHARRAANGKLFDASTTL
jgi:hypothetical protein